MPTEIRFHLDENVHGAVGNGLRLRGIDVSTTQDAQLPGASDEEHLSFARSEHRVIVTHDDDFLRLHDHRVSLKARAVHPRTFVVCRSSSATSTGRAGQGLP